MPLFTPHIHRVPAFGSPAMVPVGPVEIDQGHPLARGLLSLYLPAVTPVDLCGLGGALVADSGATPKHGSNQFGPASLGGTSSNRGLNATGGNLQAQITTQGSVLWVGDVPANGSDHSINSFGWTPNGGAVPPWHYIAIGYNLGKFAFLLANGANNDIDAFQLAASMPNSGVTATGTFNVNVGVSTAVTGYLNGVQQFNTTSTRTAALSYPAAATFQINSPSSRAPGSNTNLGAIWNRVLSADEQMWLGIEPFAMLRPRRSWPTRRGNVIGGGTAVFFLARSSSLAMAKAAPLIGAPSVLRGESIATAKQAPLAVAPVAARATSESSGRLNPGTAATVSFSGRSLSVSTGRLSSIAVATAAVRSTARGVGRMAVSLGASVRLRALSQSVGQAGLSIAGLAKKLSQLIWFN